VSIEDPSDPAKAEWDNAENDATRSQLLLRRIERHFVVEDYS
jgi:hypothetical protein